MNLQQASNGGGGERRAVLGWFPGRGLGILFALTLMVGRPPAAAAPVRAGSSPAYLLDAWETDQGLPDNSTRQMVQMPDGFLWFGTMEGLVRFDGVQFEVFTPENTPSLPDGRLVNLHLDAAQRLWLSTLSGVVVSAPGRWNSFKVEARWTGDYVRTFAEQAGVLCLTSFNGKVFRATPDSFQELAGGHERFGEFYRPAGAGSIRQRRRTKTARSSRG